MRNVTALPPANAPVQFDAQLPGGETGFTKWAPVTEDPPELYDLPDEPLEPVGICARMGLEVGSQVSYESFILTVCGFTEDDKGTEQVVVAMGNGGAALDHYLVCRPEILSPVTEWRFQGSSAPRRIGKIIPDQGQWLYIIRNYHHEVIYIGISVNAPTRWTQHQADKPWFNEAASFERIWYPNRKAVEEAEAYLIAIARPRYNTVHNPDKRRRTNTGGGVSGEDPDDQA